MASYAIMKAELLIRERVSGKRVLGYDNERGKGDHRHYVNREESIAFSSIDELLARFLSEVEAMRRPR